ncbi:hypothetical protein WJX73_000346 [Symbiochloris irregularis]|uniref:Uncharacterized protein n=1 Tax=Symbiochloris irregularis TaxID=706552 RepID=A0AAW1NUI1_9CHLO
MAVPRSLDSDSETDSVWDARMNQFRMNRHDWNPDMEVVRGSAPQRLNMRHGFLIGIVQHQQNRAEYEAEVQKQRASNPRRGSATALPLALADKFRGTRLGREEAFQLATGDPLTRERLQPPPVSPPKQQPAAQPKTPAMERAGSWEASNARIEAGLADAACVTNADSRMQPMPCSLVEGFGLAEGVPVDRYLGVPAFVPDPEDRHTDVQQNTRRATDAAAPSGGRTGFQPYQAPVPPEGRDPEQPAAPEGPSAEEEEQDSTSQKGRRHMPTVSPAHGFPLRAVVADLQNDPGHMRVSSRVVSKDGEWGPKPRTRFDQGYWTPSENEGIETAAGRGSSQRSPDAATAAVKHNSRLGTNRMQADAARRQSGPSSKGDAVVESPSTAKSGRKKASRVSSQRAAQAPNSLTGRDWDVDRPASQPSQTDQSDSHSGIFSATAAFQDLGMQNHPQGSPKASKSRAHRTARRHADAPLYQAAAVNHTRSAMLIQA